MKLGFVVTSLLVSISNISITEKVMEGLNCCVQNECEGNKMTHRQQKVCLGTEK